MNISSKEGRRCWNGVKKVLTKTKGTGAEQKKFEQSLVVLGWYQGSSNKDIRGWVGAKHFLIKTREGRSER